MYKLIDSASFYDEHEATINVINFDSLGELTKQAADNQITEYASKITPKKEKMYLHILAMGAGEYFGANKNADYFPEGNLLEHYKTFETSPGHAFRHHINKDPAKAIGKVIFAIYNPRMHRVELVVEVDKTLGRDIEERIADGDFPSTSMACKTPYDVCSICGNKAHTRQEYCKHLTSDLGRMYPDGKKAMALNVGPLKFFDISFVVKPADSTSSVLQKVAFYDNQTIGSAEAAELEGLGEKTATIRKLSEIIKEIKTDAQVDISSNLEQLLGKVADPQDVEKYRHYPLDEVFHAMGTLGISPSLKFLATLIAIKYFGPEAKGLGEVAAEYLDMVDPTSTTIPDIQFRTPETTNMYVIKELIKDINSCSLLPEYVEKRAFEVGYASFNAHEEIKEPLSHLEGHALITEPSLSPLSKTLLAIGGAALLAKLFISKVIDEKLQNQNNNVKIVLVKSASDYSLAYKLSKMSSVTAVSNMQASQNDDAKNYGLATTKFVLSNSKQKLGGKLSKIIKLFEVGTKWNKPKE